MLKLLNRRLDGFGGHRRDAHSHSPPSLTSQTQLEMYQRQRYESLGHWAAPFLDVTHKLEGGHSGCINTLNWSPNGEFLYSGSDDRSIGIWKLGPDCYNTPSRGGSGWEVGSQSSGSSADEGLTLRQVNKVLTDHRHNIFSTRVVPLTGGAQILSCSGDGGVCLNDLTIGGTIETLDLDSVLSGSMAGVAMALGIDFLPPHNESVLGGNPHVFLCTVSGTLLLYDLRKKLPASIVKKCDSHSKTDSVFSCHPMEQRVAVACNKDACLRTYDLRAPNHHMFSGTMMAPGQAEISGVCYNFDGSHIAVSSMLRDGSSLVVTEDLVDGDVTSPSGNSATSGQIRVAYAHGHTNYRTFLKQPVFFGERSQFLAHGCDSGSANIWEAGPNIFDPATANYTSANSTKNIQLQRVNCITGADSQTCNEVRPHPHFDQFPVIACSGIDHSIKLVQYPGNDKAVRYPFTRRGALHSGLTWKLNILIPATIPPSPQEVAAAQAKKVVIKESREKEDDEMDPSGPSVVVTPPPVPKKLELMTADKVAELTEPKQMGTQALTTKRYYTALRRFCVVFSKAVEGKDARVDPRHDAALLPLLTATASNATMAAMKLGRPMDETAEFCAKLVLSLDPKNVKAHFRLATVKAQQQEWEEAAKSVTEAQRLLGGTGKDGAVDALHQRATVIVKAKKDKERNVYKKMFS